MLPAKRTPKGLSPSIALGLAVRRRRRQLKLSQVELGASAGYDRNFIGLIENGQQSPTFRTLWDLCRALDIRPSTLMQHVESATFEEWEEKILPDPPSNH